jgi:hypothetical protein
MPKVSQKIALVGLLGLFGLVSFAAAQVPTRIADGSRPKGFRPLDAVQLKKIRETWPRIDKIHLNERGLERINRYRAKMGKAALEAGSVRPLGRELASPSPTTPRSSITCLPSSTTARPPISLPSPIKAISIPA